MECMHYCVQSLEFGRTLPMRLGSAGISLSHNNLAMATETEAGNKTSALGRLQALKRARAKAVLENRREVYNEASGLKTKLEKKRKLEEEADKEAEENEFSSTSAKKDSDVINFDVLKYTAEEDVKWNAKQKNIQQHRALVDEKSRGLQNYKKLAEQTYSKNIKAVREGGMKESVEAYKKEKETYDRLKAEGLTEAEIRSKITSAKKLQSYVGKVKNWEADVYEKRRKLTDEGKEGAIHEKNRLFNSKLKRHYESLEK